METIKSKIATEDKPVVQYDPKRSETINLDFGSRFGAYVYALDHPRLGEMHVTTSAVLSYDPVTGVFETRNTVYVPSLAYPIMRSMLVSHEYEYGIGEKGVLTKDRYNFLIFLNTLSSKEIADFTK